MVLNMHKSLVSMRMKDGLGVNNSARGCRVQCEGTTMAPADMHIQVERTIRVQSVIDVPGISADMLGPMLRI